MSTDATEVQPDSGFLQSRVIQIHPTLRCNLACSHCYSSSGPGENDELNPFDLIRRLTRLRSDGYDVVSFSGGEPLVYRGFAEVVRASSELGFRVNLITNGLLLGPRHLDELAPLLSRVAVSIDGGPLLHDRIRGPGTFDRTVRRLSELRDRNVVFGIAHCVTRESLPELPWLLEWAIEQRAALLQLHPIAITGRAAAKCQDQSLGPADLARLFLIARLFEIQAADLLQVQLNLVPVEHVIASKARYAVLGDQPCGGSRLADLVNPLVLDERGRAWPLAFGMAAEQCIAAGEFEGWMAMLDSYISSGARPLYGLLTSALRPLQESNGGFIDWYSYVAEHSHERSLLRLKLSP